MNSQAGSLRAAKRGDRMMANKHRIGSFESDIVKSVAMQSL